MIHTGRREKNGRPEWLATITEKAVMRQVKRVRVGQQQASDAATQYACPFCAKHECPGDARGEDYTCPQVPDDNLAEEGPVRRELARKELEK